jgi:hypothetical protein
MIHRIFQLREPLRRVHHRLEGVRPSNLGLEGACRFS